MDPIKEQRLLRILGMSLRPATVATKKASRRPKRINPPMIQTNYLQCMFAPSRRRKALKRAVKVLTPHTKEFETIVVTGVSGLLLGPQLADLLNKHLCVVRKAKGCHSPHRLEGYVGKKPYIVVDDFIASGKTVDRMLATIRKHGKEAGMPALPTAIYLYDDSDKPIQFHYTPRITLPIWR